MKLALYLIVTIFSGLSCWGLKAQVIAIWGDSLTEGYQVEKQTAYPQLLEKLLKEKGYVSAKVYNLGISGATTNGLSSKVKVFLDGKKKEKIHIGIIALGSNDGLRGAPLKLVRQNLEAGIRKLESKKVLPVLVGFQIPPNYGEKYTTDFKNLFSDLQKKLKLKYYIPFLLEGVAGIPQKNLPDRIHPNPSGYKIVAQTVLKEVLKALEDEVFKGEAWYKKK